MRSVQGSHASYNVQAVTDDKYGLLVHVEAVKDSSDVDQFARQIEAANEDLAKVCEVACGDAGYANTEELRKIDERGLNGSNVLNKLLPQSVLQVVIPFSLAVINPD